MESNISPPAEFYSNLVDNANITKYWILVNTPIPVLSILAVYLLVILKWGPRFMEGRRPYDLNTAMRVYNLVQVIYNLSLIIYPIWCHASRLSYVLELSCRLPQDSDENVHQMKMDFLVFSHGYLVLKILDLTDTMFMVLGKKFSHITFLHVYHHTSMIGLTWFTLKYVKPVQAVIPGWINLCVHVIMYTYYFLATFGEPVKKYLWWKIYLTKLQLGQFVIILIYISALYYNNCPISQMFTYIWLFNVFVILCLFVNFYFKTYVVKPAVEEKSKIS